MPLKLRRKFMIEYGTLSKLDNDYITLWSDFILYGPSDSFRKNLTKLAELGQINAIQSWLLLKKGKETNLKIENHIAEIEKLEVLNYNEKLVLSHKYLNNEKTRINDLLYEYNEQKNNINEFSFDLTEEEEKAELQELNDIKNSMLKLKSVKYKYEVMNDIISYPGYLQNPFLMERCAELCEWPSPLAIFTSKNDRAKKQAFKMLKKLYKQYRNDARIKYHLGKNLVFWANENSKAKKLGAELLESLALRPLSFTTSHVNDLDN